MSQLNNFLKKYYAEITAVLAFIIYNFTMAPSVMEIDAGELATVQTTLGIAHPTGYPLFTILGYLFQKIPLPLSPIYKANLFAAFFCALGIWIFIKFSVLILKHSLNVGALPQQTKRKKGSKNSQHAIEKLSDTVIIFSAVCSGIILAFNKTIWTQSTSVEVYSLQIFLIGWIIFTVIKAYFRSEDKLTNWAWFGFVLALGFSNHMTTLLLLPFGAILFFMREKLNSSCYKKIIFSLAAFVPTIILFYSYLPIRASMKPILNWGNPVSLENFFRHVSGKQYQVWMFSSIDAAKEHLTQFLKEFPGEFGYAGLIIGLIGIYFSYKAARKIFYALLVTFIFAVLYTVNYDIHDLDSYFSTAYIIFSVFIAFGFVQLWIYAKDEFNNQRTAAVILLAASLFPLALNYADVDESGIHTYEDYTKAVLNSTDRNSIILSYQWDYFVSASYYFHYVEGFRKDVTVIDKELLRRSWYYLQLERDFPEVMKNLNPETSAFLNAVKLFERGDDFDPHVIEQCYRNFMTELVAKNITGKSFYVGPEMVQNEMQRGEFSLPQGYQVVPDLLLFKVVKGNEYVPAADPNFSVRIPNRKDHYTGFIENITASMLTYRAMYELQFNKVERAKIYIDKVKHDFPDFRLPPQIEDRIQ